MALSFVYRLVRHLAELLRVHRMDAAAKDAEFLVLRHQLAVLQRQVARPQFSWSDRALTATLAKLVPRERWAAFLVTPETILRWHRALVRRRWTYLHRGPGRPRLPQETVEVIVRLSKENSRHPWSTGTPTWLEALRSGRVMLSSTPPHYYGLLRLPLGAPPLRRPSTYRRRLFRAPPGGSRRPLRFRAETDLSCSAAGCGHVPLPRRRRVPQGCTSKLFAPSMAFAQEIKGFSLFRVGNPWGVQANNCSTPAPAERPSEGRQSGQPRGGWLIPIVTGGILGPGSSRAGRPHVASLGSAAP